MWDMIVLIPENCLSVTLLYLSLKNAELLDLFYQTYEHLKYHAQLS